MLTSESVVSKKRPFDELIKHRKIVPAIRDFPPGCGFTEAERKPLKVLTKSHSDIGKMNRVEPNMFNSSKPKEFGGNKPSVVSMPAGKVKFWDPRCTKDGYDQKPKVTTTYGMQRKNFTSVDSSVDKLVKVKPLPVENNKLKTFEPKVLERSKSYLGPKSTPKVKFWDPNSETQKPEDTTTVVSTKEQIQRVKIQEAMDYFDQFYETFSENNRLKPKSEQISSRRLPTEAAKIVKQKLKWRDPGKIMGPVCGVQVGDKFKYRALLVMIGLHNQHDSGIDYTKIGGNNLAISIVDAHRYSNVSGSGDTLVYSGQGGHGLYGWSKGPPEDQKLERGNLALKNSMDKKSQVRVIRKVQGYGKDVFAYDGLYTVNDYTEEKGAEGKIVFKFHLKRVPGQPSLHEMLKW